MLGHPDDDAGPGTLDLVASAIAGTPLAVAPGRSGEPTWTDGTTVHVDPDLAPPDRFAAVAVQACLVGAGSLAPTILTSLGRRGTAERYVAIEGHRALDASRDLLPPGLRSLADGSVAARTDGPAASLALARSREPVDGAPPVFGTVRARSVRAERIAEGRDAAARHVPRSARDTLRELDDDEDTDAPGGADTLNPIGGGGAVGRLLQRLLGTSRSRGEGEPGAEAATHRTRHGGRVGRGRAVSSTTVDLAEGVAALHHRSVSYPEWDAVRRRYRDGWCTVSEVDVEPDETGSPAGHDARTARRSLAHVGLGLERRRRQPQGDDLDVDAVVQARVELAAGRSPEERLYVDSVRNRRELSVLLLLDVSGSAQEPSPSGGCVHDHQVAAAGQLTQALHVLGDRVALYGFRSQGRSAVQVLPVKRFDGAFDLGARRRLHRLAPGGYTRMGAAVRHGASVLEADGGTVRRLLVVLSDGFAYDHGYEGAYAEADARRALAEARRRGTACLCLSIGADADVPALRRVFGTAAYASFPTADRLAPGSGPLAAVALRLAEVQRTTSQRKERARRRLRVEGSTA